MLESVSKESFYANGVYAFLYEILFLYEIVLDKLFFSFMLWVFWKAYLSFSQEVFL